jgi:hypothetical protein
MDPAVVPEPSPTSAAPRDGFHPREDASRRARHRLLQIAVFGGALIGAFIGQVALIMTDQPREGLVSVPGLISLLAGYIPGYLVGRGVFALVHGRDPEAADRWEGHVWILLATPAYLVAGIASASFATIGTLLAAPDAGAGVASILVTLLVAWIVLAPVTLAFAPSTTGHPKLMHRHVAGCSGTFWILGFAALWFGGSFLAVLSLLAAAESASPTAYARAADSSLFAVLMLGAWLALWAGGSAAVYRLLRRALMTRDERVGRP